MTLSEIRKRAFDNMNRNIGHIVLVMFLLGLLAFGLLMFAMFFMWIPFLGYIVQIFISLAISFLSIAMCIMYLKAYRGEKPTVGVIGDIVDDKHFFKYLKVVLSNFYVMTVIEFCIFGSILLFVFFASMSGIDQYSSAADIAIWAFLFCVYLIFVIIIIYVVIMFLKYVFFVAIDAKKDAKALDICTLANKLVSGKRKKHFFMDLFFIGIYVILMVIFTIIFLIFFFVVGFTESILLAFGMFPLFFLMFIITTYFMMFNSISFAGLYDEFLLDCEYTFLMNDVYDEEFLEKIRIRKEELMVK